MITLTVHRYSLGSVDATAHLAQALVCPDVEYACVLWTETKRLERRPCTPNLWHSFRQEASCGLSSGVIPRVSAASIMLVGARLSAVQIEYVGNESIDVPKEDPTAGLDRWLRDVAASRDARPLRPGTRGHHGASGASGES